MPDGQIRLVAPHELESLQRISETCFIQAFADQNTEQDMNLYISEHLSLEKIRQEYTDPESKFYFALLSETPAGYLKINMNADHKEFQLTNSMEIQRIYVLQDFYGRQIGQQLMDFALRTARKEGKDSICLGVWEHNQRALQFYRKNGFAVYGTHSFLLGMDQQTDLLMKRNV